MSTPTTFRSHDHTPPMTSPQTLIGGLLVEWVQLNASRPAALTVTRWAHHHPTLAGAHRPGDIVDTIDKASPDDQDMALLALVTLAQNGEQLAGRIVLQQMLPKLSQLARDHQATLADGVSDPDGPDERYQILTATFWQVVMTYPIDRRPRKVAANLALDTLLHSTKAAATYRREHLTLQTELADNHRPTQRPDAHDDALPPTLTTAITNGTLDEPTARMLHDIYGRGESPTAYAHRTGLKPNTLRKRCMRARQRLRDSLTTNMPIAV